MDARCFRRFAGVLAVLLPLAWAGSAAAAILEFDMRRAIADSVAVLRYLYKQREDAKDNLAMVEYSVQLTKEQLERQKALIERAKTGDDPADVKKVKLAYFSRTLKTLQIHMEKMTAVNWEKMFAERVKQVSAQLEEQRIILDAKITEYRAQFGAEPPVDLSYEEQATRLRPKVETPGLLLVR